MWFYCQLRPKRLGLDCIFFDGESMLDEDDRKPCDWPLCEDPRVLTVVGTGLCSCHFYSFNDIVDVCRRTDRKKISEFVGNVLAACDDITDDELENLLIAAWAAIMNHNNRKNLAQTITEGQR